MMHKTTIDLGKSVRKGAIDLLHARLADAIDLQLRCKHAHWNVRGAQFISLHELFDKLHAEVEEHVDDLAERAAALGSSVDGRVTATAKKSSLKAYPDDLVTGEDHLKALAASFAEVGARIRGDIEAAAKVGDLGTSDLFTGMSRELDKSLWFIEAHLQG